MILNQLRKLLHSLSAFRAHAQDPVAHVLPALQPALERFVAAFLQIVFVADDGCLYVLVFCLGERAVNERGSAAALRFLTDSHI